MSFYLPEIPEEPEEIEYPSDDKDDLGQQDSNSDGSPIDQAQNVKDKFDDGKNLKNKLAGNNANQAAKTTKGAGDAGKAAKGAGEAARTAKTASQAAEAAKTVAQAAKLAKNAGPQAIVTLPMEIAALRKKEVRDRWVKIIGGTLGGVFMFCLFPFAIILIVIFAFIFWIFGTGSGEATGLPGGGGIGSSILVVSKSVTPNIIPKGTPNAQVTFTITVKNNSDKEATNVVVTDSFGSDPPTTASFVGEITGVESSYTIGSIPPGGTSTKSFTVTIPHTDFDPGWLLTNTARATGTVGDGSETSTMSTTVVIGNPPSVPPTGCPMLGDITSPMGRNIPGYPLPSHDGIDISDGVKNNAPVYATLSGTLTYTGYKSGTNGEWTERVTITSGIYEVSYAHLSNVGKAPEGPVVVGQVIGHEDETGYTIGEHLHYEVKVNKALVNPLQFMPAELSFTQPANNNFTGFVDQAWGSCNILPQAPVVITPPHPPDAGNEFFIFSDAGEKAWTRAEKDAVTRAVQTPIRSSTWKNLVFGADKITVTRSAVDPECADVCSGYAEDANSLILRDLFFNLTDRGRVFVITHELTHILQSRNSRVNGQFSASSANSEFQTKGVIVSYPLCYIQSCLFGLSPFNENFAEMAGNYVADRDGYSINFPNDYPEHYKFAKDILFGGTSF